MRTVQEFARRIVCSGSLDEKLERAPAGLEDAPGPAEVHEGPGRPGALSFAECAVKVPPAQGMHDPEQKVRLLHAFANHELQATELFAWALLAFPDSPAAFRSGLLRILGEEQAHVRMYRGRLNELGAELGDFAVNGYFWGKIRGLEKPAEFVCAMGLTFENANLDHTLHYAAAARAAGDERTARLIEQVHRDEIGHVRFGWTWLERFKVAEQSMWEAYQANVRWPLRAALARGRAFDEASRREAGLDEGFIAQLARAANDR